MDRYHPPNITAPFCQGMCKGGITGMWRARVQEPAADKDEAWGQHFSHRSYESSSREET
jgi:hypothetical protein